MSDFEDEYDEYDEFEEDEQDHGGPKPLRDQLKALKRQLAAAKKEADEAKSLVRNRAVADVLADKGFKNPDRVKRDMLNDSIDPLDTDAVSKWLADNGDDYAKATSESSPGGASEDEQSASVSPEIAEAYGQLDVQGGDPAASDNWQRAFAEIKTLDNPTGDEVKAVYARHGV